MVNQAGKWKVEVRKQQDKRLSVYAPFLGQWTGFMGRSDGVIQDPTRPPGYVFVQDNNGLLMTMWNQRVPIDQPGLPIVYGYTADEPKVLQVISQWTSYSQQPSMNIGHHHTTHEFGSGDMVPVHGEQILPWLVWPSWQNPATPSAFFSIDIFPGLDRVGTTWIFKTATTIDLTSHIPTSGARFVVVCMDTAGVYTVVDGTPISTPELLTGADIPAETAGTVVKAIVRLFVGQEKIRQENNPQAGTGYSDIFDDRFAVGMGGGGGGLTDAVSDYSTYGRNNTTWSNIIDASWMIEPAQITADQNDYNPTGYVSTTRTIKSSANAPHNITGLTGGSRWRGMTFLNVGTQAITFKNHDGGSSAVNQFDNGGGDFVLNAGKYVTWLYDTGNLWFYVSDGNISALSLDQIVVADELGRESAVTWMKINDANKMLLLGWQYGFFPWPLGTGFSILDDAGHTGGEGWLWGIGTGTSGDFASEFGPRFWLARALGTKTVPTGITANTVIGDLVAIGLGDNGDLLTPAEIATYPDRNAVHGMRGIIRAVADGDFTNTSRPVRWEFWNTPVGSYVRQLAATLHSNGTFDGPSIPPTMRVLDTNITLLDGQAWDIDRYIRLGTHDIHLQGDSELRIRSEPNGVFNKGHLFGLGLSNNSTDSVNDIDIAVGECRNSSNNVDMILSVAITKQLDVAWAAGNHAGGLDTGAIADNTYHVFIIKNSSTGLVDALFSLSPTMPIMPAGYSYFRLIGSIVRSGATILSFLQVGNQFWWTGAGGEVLDLSAGAATTGTAVALTVPTGRKLEAIVDVLIVAGAGGAGARMYDADIPGTVNLIAVRTNVSGNFGVRARCYTNTSAQVKYYTTSGSTVSIATQGWIDTRGILS